MSEPIAINEETRKRVLEVVEQLGYQPNVHAGSLRGQKTRMIAIMIADIANPFYHPMVRAVQDIAYAHRCVPFWVRPNLRMLRRSIRP